MEFPCQMVMDLLGDASSAQSAIFLPDLQNSNLYFLITVDVARRPIHYSLIDVTLNGGLGDVVDGSKNIELLDNSEEKVTATIKADGSGYWVVGVDDGDYYAFTAANGVIDPTTPVVSSLPSTNVSGDIVGQARRGYLRLSPDGTRIANTTYALENGGFIADFDNTTGVVSNPIRLTNGPTPNFARRFYGVEFSPDSQILYVSANNQNTGNGCGVPNGIKQILQYDLNGGPGFEDNSVIIGLQTGAPARGALQLGLNGRIYHAQACQSFLGVITDPNVLGTGANFIEQDVTLNAGQFSREGLPPFVSSFLVNNIFASDADIVDSDFATEFCDGSQIQFEAGQREFCETATFFWSFDDGTTSTLEDPLHTYANPGQYTVILTVTIGGLTFVASDVITIFDNPTLGTIDPSLLDICDLDGSGDELVDLTQFSTDLLDGQDPSSFGISYHANANDAELNQNPLPTNFLANLGPNEIFVRVADNSSTLGCSAIGSFIVNIIPVVTVSNIPDFEICDDSSLDGFEAFDLASFITTIATQAGDPVNIEYTLYTSQSDADLGTSPIDITVPFTNTTNPQTLFVRLENTNDMDCASTAPFNLVVLAGASVGTVPDLLNTCDGSVELDLSLFELETLNAAVLNGANANDFTVSYHTTDVDAQNDENELPLNYIIPTETEDTTITLFIRLENNQTGCFDTSTFSIVFQDCSTGELFIPQGFSPNDDSVNDTFEITGLQDLENFDLQIFNRYGTLIYETGASNYQEFAGIANKGLLSGDGLLPVATYFYVLQFNDPEREDAVGWLYMNY